MRVLFVVLKRPTGNVTSLLIFYIFTEPLMREREREREGSWHMKETMNCDTITPQ